MIPQQLCGICVHYIPSHNCYIIVFTLPFFGFCCCIIAIKSISGSIEGFGVLYSSATSEWMLKSRNRDAYSYLKVRRFGCASKLDIIVTYLYIGMTPLCHLKEGRVKIESQFYCDTFGLTKCIITIL